MVGISYKLQDFDGRPELFVYIFKFFKETRKGTVKNIEHKNDSFQKLIVFLGVGIVLSELLFFQNSLLNHLNSQIASFLTIWKVEFT